MDKALSRIQALPIWQGKPNIAPLDGGLTNLNYRVTDQSGDYVVRLGADIPEHQVMRFNELAAARAAHAAGISPAVVHAEDGLTVIEFIKARTLQESDIRTPETLEETLILLHKCHHEVPRYLRGPVLMFWVFHVLRDYAATLAERNSRHLAAIPEYLEFTARLEEAVGAVEIV
ncbi:MAG TPA: choline kinase, partial [Aliiroseovarius sp.]|nr:choline kinase [Aliiroseovarius sp.]